MKLISWSFLLSVLLFPTVEQPSRAQTVLLLDDIQSEDVLSSGEQTGMIPEPRSMCCVRGALDTSSCTLQIPFHSSALLAYGRRHK